MENKKRLLLSGVLLLGFSIFALGVHLQAGWMGTLDLYGNNIFRLSVPKAVTEVVFLLTRIGDIRSLLIIGSLVGVVLLAQKKWKDFLWLSVSAGIIGGLSPFTFKLLFMRPRPTDGLLTRGGYSFSSGHAMGALAVYGLIILLVRVYVRKTWLRRGIIGLATSVIVIVSWSRIHLGFHFLSDIIGSWFLGLGLLIVAQVILKRMKRRKIWGELPKWR